MIGAGTAGLAAGRRVMEAGRSVLVIEAADHVGGRCVTDMSLGTPFDRGGSWLHAATANPLTPWAERYGMTIHEDHFEPSRVWHGEEELSAEARLDFIEAREDAFAAMRRAGADGRDVPVATVLPDSPYRAALGHVAAWITGHDPEEISTLDESRFVEAEGDWLLNEGLGSLIARHGAGVPVKLSCPAGAIDYSGPAVAVATLAGTIRAPRAIVTVSTGLLAAGGIAFTPALPDWKARAIEDLPLGLLNKVVLRFPGGLGDAGADQWLSYFPSEGEGMGLRANWLGGELTVCFLGGRFARDMELAGPGAATDFARQAVAAFFGPAEAGRIAQSDETRWLADPHTLGAYSGARPGRAEARADMARPLDDRVFFAGEACSIEWFATVAGAHLTGIAAAEAALASLD